MACHGRFYVLGPPVPDEKGVKEVVQQMMEVAASHRKKEVSETPAKRRKKEVSETPAQLEMLEGPLRYDSSWVAGARNDDLRRARDAAALWTGKIEWDKMESAMSFSVIVIDYDHWHPKNKEHRKDGQRIPSFETFVVAILKEEQTKVDWVYEWRTRRLRDWRNRGEWLHVLSTTESEASRRHTTKSLQQLWWYLIYELEDLCVPWYIERLSRKQKKGSATHEYGWHPVKKGLSLIHI